MPQRTLWGYSPEESLFNFSDAPSLPDEPEPTPTLRLAQLFLQKLFAYSNFDSHKRECIPENDDGLISPRDVDVKEWFDRVWKVAKHKQIAEYMNETVYQLSAALPSEKKIFFRLIEFSHPNASWTCE